jgi:hypothetical protein
MMPLIALFLAVGLFAGMLLCQEIGRRLGQRHLARNPAGAIGTGAVEGSVLALFGLLLAFTFSGAGSRFEARRHLIVEEANCIGTAYLRVDLMPAEMQPAMRNLFKQYLDSRIEVYREISNLTEGQEGFKKSARLQQEIWRLAISACGPDWPPPGAMLLLPALNQMFDITTTREMALKEHPPEAIFVLLFGLGLGCSLVAGFGMSEGRSRNWIHVAGFAAITAITVYVILDFEYPRLGLIRVDAADRVLVGLRENM